MLRGFITNLGKYNEGQLIGKWIDFPITEDELEEVKNQIGINDFYEEYFFTDWETDWDFSPYSEWGEYPNMDDVNEVAENLEQIEYQGEMNWLLAYFECQGGSIIDAISYYEDNSRFYGEECYGAVEDVLRFQCGIEGDALAVFMNCLDIEQFMDEFFDAYHSEFGYIECF